MKAKIDQACRAAEEFIKLYYESLDKRRYVSIWCFDSNCNKIKIICTVIDFPS